jgi:hypothetical protein
MKHLFSKIAPIAAAILVLIQPTFAGDLNNMRGQRYGEVLVGKGGVIAPTSFDVYNTIGLNDCPQALWSKLDAQKIKAETGAKMVKLNGPRYWMIDGIRNSSLVSKQIRSFGGLQMRQAGTLELSLMDELSAGKPYSIHKVARNTTWVFDAGKPVYQLISPDDSVFFMQSYSVQKQNQDQKTLANLGSQLKLPKGWKFRSVVLKNNFDVTAANGMAYVVQDDLDNTYQRSSAGAGDVL